MQRHIKTCFRGVLPLLTFALFLLFFPELSAQSGDKQLCEYSLVQTSLFERRKAAIQRFRGKTLFLDSQIFFEVGPRALEEFPQANVVISLDVLKWAEIHAKSRDLGERDRALALLSFFKSYSTKRDFRLKNKSVIKFVVQSSEEFGQKATDQVDSWFVTTSLYQEIFAEENKTPVIRPELDFITPYSGVTKIKIADSGSLKGLLRRGAVQVSRNGFFPNQWVIVEPNILTQFRAQDQKLVVVPEDSLPNTVLRPRNWGQFMAAHMLLNPDLDYVSLTGKGGTGKTLLALHYALVQTIPEWSQFYLGRPPRYQQIIYTKPLKEMGETSLGTLPGGTKSKLGNVNLSLEDAVHALARIYLVAKTKLDEGKGSSLWTQFRKNPIHAAVVGQPFEWNLALFNQLNDLSDSLFRGLFEQKFLSIEPWTHMRGRSFPDTLLIVDEVQNSTTQEAETLATRMGENSKVVFLGDLSQLDQNRTDELFQNGLYHLLQKLLVHHPSAGHIELETSERNQSINGMYQGPPSIWMPDL